MKQPKKHYYILLNGYKVGETWAVSEAKAINNYWWKYVKGGDEYGERSREPEDFDAVQV